MTGHVVFCSRFDDIHGGSSPIKHSKEEDVKRTNYAVIAGAVTLLTASSVLAVEHQFNGSFKVQLDASNMNGSASGDGNYTPSTTEKKAQAANFVDSRARIGYTARVNSDLKFVSMFELDYEFWGNSSYTVGRNSGGALGADSVNIETKNLYLDANIDSRNNVKLGMQGVADSFKGVFVDADMAGALLTHTCDNITGHLGLFRFDDKSNTTTDALGQKTRDFLVLDAGYSLSKTTRVGGAYYYLRDRSDLTTNNDKIHFLGINGETTAAPLSLTGFVVGQFGEVTAAKKDLTAFAANVGAALPLGAGTLRSEFLYASGDSGSNPTKSKAFQSVPGESGYYNNEMVILGRDKNALTIDNAIVYDANNKNHGVMFLSAGYDIPLSSKLTCSTNLGLAWNAKKQAGESGKYLGTEINAEAAYKLNDNMTLSARAGYVFLGDFYDGYAANGTPDNPYDIKLIAKIVF